MKIALKPLALAGALAFGAVTSASAALLDFTDNTVGLTGSIAGAGYTVTGFPTDPKQTVGAPGPTGVLLGENDGLGIKNDEITFPGEYVVITFTKAVTIKAAYFLDVFFAASNPRDTESAIITKGALPGAIDAAVAASVPTSEGVGYAEILGVTLKGTTFTFWAGPGTDDNSADVALAAIEVAPIPLPAGALLIGTAFGAFGLMRRRKRA